MNDAAAVKITSASSSTLSVSCGAKSTELQNNEASWRITTVGQEFLIELGKMLDVQKNTGNPKPYLGNSSVQWGRFDLSDVGEIRLTASELARFRLRSGDLLVCEGGEVGRSAIWKGEFEECYYQKALHRLRPKRGFNVALMRYLLEYFSQEGSLANFVTQTSIAHLPKDKFALITIPLPPAIEQQAIAEALSDADALIEGLESLIAKKRAIKQGAMQELLTGKRRLPGFEGEWIESAIQHIAAVGRGRVISHKEINRSINASYPVYSSQTTHNGVMGLLDSFMFEGDYVTWTTDGANAGTTFYRSGKFNCTNVCGTIKLIDKSGSHFFVANALGLVAKDHVSRHLGNPKLMNDVMKRISIRLPPTTKEQSAIATVLSDMDAEINALDAKLKKSRAVKQGMMQELLTGRVRLV